MSLPTMSGHLSTATALPPHRQQWKLLGGARNVDSPAGHTQNGYGQCNVSIHRKRRSDGKTVYVVRWREGGRSGKQRASSFDARRDAEYFETSMRRARQLGQLGSELLGSNQTLDEFIGEWWEKHAIPILAPGTLAGYVHPLDKWIIPYLGHMRMRDLSREAIDGYRATLVAAGAGAPTVNRCLGILQGILQRAVEWRRISWNPVAGVRRIPHTRDSAIDARSPEIVERIRSVLPVQHAVLVAVLAYEGLRPGEAFALTWQDVLDGSGEVRHRLLVRRALSDHRVSTTKSQRDRSPELFHPVARDLLELHELAGQPAERELVFPDDAGGHLRRQNWRQRVWMPALLEAGVGYFRPYDLRHTCATLLIYEGRTVNEVARHLGHADPGFTARTYAHIYEDAGPRRQVPIDKAIMRARVRQVFPNGTADAPDAGAEVTETPANRKKPTRGLEPRTPSLRVMSAQPDNPYEN